MQVEIEKTADAEKVSAEVEEKKSDTEKVKKCTEEFRRGKNLKNLIFQWIQLFIGAAIASAGLELFLIPNNVIDGGVVGLSIMGHYLLSTVPFGVEIRANMRKAKEIFGY